MPCTLEQIIEYFHLADTDESALNTRNSLQAEHANKIQKQEESPRVMSSPVLAKRPGDAGRKRGVVSVGTRDAHDEALPRCSKTPPSWSDKSRDVQLGRAASKSWAGTQLRSAGGSGVSGGGKLERMTSRGGLGSHTVIKEKVIAKKKKPKTAVSASASGKRVTGLVTSTSSQSRVRVEEAREGQTVALGVAPQVFGQSVASKHGKADLDELQSVTARDKPLNKEAGLQARGGHISSSRQVNSRSADWSKSQSGPPAHADRHLSTPARCKVATVLVPETPETKANGKNAAGANTSRVPPRMATLPAVTKFAQESSAVFSSSCLAAQPPAVVSEFESIFALNTIRSMYATEESEGQSPAGGLAAMLSSKQSRNASPIRKVGLFSASTSQNLDSDIPPGTCRELQGKDASRMECKLDAVFLESGSGHECSQQQRVAKAERLMGKPAHGAAIRASASSAKETQQNEVAEADPGDGGAFEYYRYEIGDWALVSTKHIHCKKGKACLTKKAFPSQSSVIGPFEVVDVKTNRSPSNNLLQHRFKLRVPKLIKFEPVFLDPCALQLFKTKAQTLSEPIQTRVQNKLRSENLEDCVVIDHVLDVQVLPVHKDKGPPALKKHALVAWQGEFPEEEKFTWEPLDRNLVHGRVSEKHDAVMDFATRQKAGFTPSKAPCHLSEADGFMAVANGSPGQRIDPRDAQIAGKEEGTGVEMQAAAAKMFKSNTRQPMAGASDGPSVQPICLRPRLMSDHLVSSTRLSGSSATLEPEGPRGAATPKGMPLPAIDDVKQRRRPKRETSPDRDDGKAFCKQQCSDSSRRTSVRAAAIVPACAIPSAREEPASLVRGRDSREQRAQKHCDSRLEDAQQLPNARNISAEANSNMDPSVDGSTSARVCPGLRPRRQLEKPPRALTCNASRTCRTEGARFREDNKLMEIDEHGKCGKRRREEGQAPEATSRQDVDGPSPSKRRALQVGDPVFAWYPAGTESGWYAATISARLTEASRFEVAWEDGDDQNRIVSGHRIRHRDLIAPLACKSRQEATGGKKHGASVLEVQPQSEACGKTAGDEGDRDDAEVCGGGREARARVPAVRFRPGRNTQYAFTFSKLEVKEEVEERVTDALEHVVAFAHAARAAFDVGDLVLVSTADESVLRTLGNGRTEPFGAQALTKFVGPFEVLSFSPPGRYKLKMPRGRGAKLPRDGDVCDGDIGIDGDEFDAGALTLFRSADEHKALRAQRQQRARGRGGRAGAADVCHVDFVLDRRKMMKNGKSKGLHALVAWQGVWFGVVCG